MILYRIYVGLYVGFYVGYMAVLSWAYGSIMVGLWWFYRDFVADLGLFGDGFNVVTTTNPPEFPLEFP